VKEAFDVDTVEDEPQGWADPRADLALGRAQSRAKCRIRYLLRYQFLARFNVPYPLLRSGRGPDYDERKRI
jgi:hypothetical protein